MNSIQYMRMCSVFLVHPVIHDNNSGGAILLCEQQAVVDKTFIKNTVSYKLLPPPRYSNGSQVRDMCNIWREESPGLSSLVQPLVINEKNLSISSCRSGRPSKRYKRGNNDNERLAAFTRQT